MPPKIEAEFNWAVSVQQPSVVIPSWMQIYSGSLFTRCKRTHNLKSELQQRKAHNFRNCQTYNKYYKNERYLDIDFYLSQELMGIISLMLRTQY